MRFNFYNKGRNIIIKIGMTSDLIKTHTANHWRTTAEGVHKSVINIVNQNHVLPFIFPTVPIKMVDTLLNSVDGIFITGGLDVDPHFYNESRTNLTTPVNPQRDRFEISLVRRAIQLKKPVLGLCRGLQIINVALGGNLYQDISHQNRQPLIQHQQMAPGNQPTHRIFIKPNTYLAQTLGLTSWVNSRHHEAIKDVGRHLIVSAYAPDHIVEAVENSDGLLQGIQWHPEDLYQEYPKQAKLFINFFKRVKVFKKCKFKLQHHILHYHIRNRFA